MRKYWGKIGFIVYFDLCTNMGYKIRPQHNTMVKFCVLIAESASIPLFQYGLL